MSRRRAVEDPPAAVVDLGRQRALLAWYRQHRRPLPWRDDGPGRHPDPYRVLLSEAMLQQTRVETVIAPYARWLERFPTLAALAAAPEDEVVAAWAGLGYYRRARALHATARAIVAQHGGALPAAADALRALPGLGPYTVGAIRSIAFDLPAPLVDGNVARVFARWWRFEAEVDAPPGLAWAWRAADGELAAPGPARADPSRWNQALMELGAVVCLPRAPRCEACPVIASCAAQAAGVEAALPRRAARRAPLPVRARAFVLQRQRAEGAEVWLARCPPRGRWAGLWQPPMAEGDAAFAAAESALRELLGPHAAALAAAGALEHVLTHRRYAVELVAATLPAATPEPSALLRWTRDLGFDAGAWRPVAAVSGVGDGVSRLGARLVGHRCGDG